MCNIPIKLFLNGPKVFVHKLAVGMTTGISPFLTAETGVVSELNSYKRNSPNALDILEEKWHLLHRLLTPRRKLLTMWGWYWCVSFKFVETWVRLLIITPISNCYFSIIPRESCCLNSRGSSLSQTHKQRYVCQVSSVVSDSVQPYGL